MAVPDGRRGQQRPSVLGCYVGCRCDYVPTDVQIRTNVTKSIFRCRCDYVPTNVLHLTRIVHTNVLYLTRIVHVDVPHFVLDFVIQGW